MYAARGAAKCAIQMHYSCSTEKYFGETRSHREGREVPGHFFGITIPQDVGIFARGEWVPFEEQTGTAGQPVVVVVASSSSFRVLKSEPRPSHPEPPFDRRGFDLQPVDERSANACIIHNQFPNPELEMNRRPGQLPLPLLHPSPLLHSPCIPLIFSATSSFKRFLRRFLRENVVCSPARSTGRLRAAGDSEISCGVSGYVSWAYGLFVVWFFRVFVENLSIVSSSL